MFLDVSSGNEFNVEAELLAFCPLFAFLRLLKQLVLYLEHSGSKNFPSASWRITS